MMRARRPTRPTVPGLRSASLGIVPDHDAGLGGAVVLVDHRPPPFDHLPLHRRRAGRGAMGDPAQRGQVVAPAHLLGQPQQAHEHGRHDVHVADAMPLDQPQHVLGLEARLQHDVEAEPGAAHAVGGGRRVVHRPVHQHDDRRIGLEAPVAPPPRPAGRLLLRRRWAGGARPWAGRSCPRCRSCCRARAWAARYWAALARHEGVPGLHARRRHAAARPARCRHRRSRRASARPAPSRRRECRRDLGQQVGVRHQHLGARSRPGCSPPPPA